MALCMALSKALEDSTALAGTGTKTIMTIMIPPNILVDQQVKSNWGDQFQANDWFLVNKWQFDGQKICEIKENRI